MKVRILAEFTVAPENVVIAEKLFKELEVETSKEHGCMVYELRQVSGEENTFIIYEVFADRESQEWHKLTKHYTDILKGQIEPLVINKRVRFLL